MSALLYGKFYCDVIILLFQPTQAAYGQQQPQQYQGYTAPGAPGQVPPANTGNPYTRGPSYGQYPRPQGQYPQPYQ